MLFLRRSLIYDAGYTKVGTDNRASWIAPKHEDDGYNALVKFVQKGADNAKFLEWLLNDYEALQLYVTGGIPGGRSWWQDGASHVRSIEQFMALAKAHPDDITRGKTSEADRVVYKKMMVSAALGMNDRTRLWTGTTKPADPWCAMRSSRNSASTATSIALGRISLTSCPLRICAGSLRTALPMRRCPGWRTIRWAAIRMPRTRAVA